MKAKFILTTPNRSDPPSGSPGFSLRWCEEAFPRNFTAELREQFRQLGPPPACLRFRGCVRLVYRAAKQIGVRITVRKRPRGAYLIWKLPNRFPQAPTPECEGDVAEGLPQHRDSE
jgi:hypothetical protein